MMNNNKKKPYRVVIVDDDDMAIDELKLNLRSYADLEVVATSKIGGSGKKIILKEKPDLLFLDIQLPDTDGVKLLEEISDKVNWKMQVVFFTAHESYMRQAIRKSVFDYLLKPIDKDELVEIIEKFYKNRKTEDKEQLLLPDINEALYRLMPENKILLIAANSEKKVTRLNDIGYLVYNSSTKQWDAQLVNGSQISIKKNTSAKDILGCSSYFRQPHQSYIINLNFLQAIKGYTCFLLPPFDMVEIPVSRSGKNDLEDGLINL